MQINCDIRIFLEHGCKVGFSIILQRATIPVLTSGNEEKHYQSLKTNLCSQREIQSGLTLSITPLRYPSVDVLWRLK